MLLRSQSSCQCSIQLGGYVLGFVLLSECSSPSDEKLIRTFREHRNDFDNLIAMSNKEPGITRISSDSAAKAKCDYQVLFDKTDLNGGLDTSWQRSVSRCLRIGVHARHHLVLCVLRGD